MPRKYSIAEARASLARLVDDAEAGAEIELTRRGQPVAVIVSHSVLDQLRQRRAHFGDAYRVFLERFGRERVGLEPGDADAWRDRSRGRKVRL
jgi:prevent-host-death family protein